MKLDNQMKECMREYIEQLKVEYDNLSTDPFAHKARISIRQEIEAIRDMLEEDRMSVVWDQISTALNLNQERPDRHKEGLRRLQEQEDAVTDFKSRMTENTWVD